MYNDENEPCLTLLIIIIFCNQQSNNKVKVMFDDVETERVYENTFLAVIIDNILCWNAHMNHVITKMSTMIAIFYQTKDILNQKSLF